MLILFVPLFFGQFPLVYSRFLFVDLACYDL